MLDKGTIFLHYDQKIHWFLLVLSVWHTKKTWIPTAVVPRVEAVALPISLEQQREAHAEYKIYSSAT